MSVLELLAVILGGGTLAAIVNALIAARTTARTAHGVEQVAAGTERLEERRLDMSLYRDTIADLRATLADTRAQHTADRERWEADLAEEKAIAASALSARETDRAELLELRALLAAVTRPPEDLP